MTFIEPREKTPSSVRVATDRTSQIPEVSFVECKTNWSRSTPADGELFKQEFENIYENLKKQVSFLNRLTKFLLNENVGLIAGFVSYDVPPNWMFCDGRVLLKSQFPLLYKKLKGLTWQNKTLFRIPDYQGYFLRGNNSGEPNNPDFARELKHTQRAGIAMHTHGFSGKTTPTSIDGDTIELRTLEDENTYSTKDASNPNYKYGPIGAYSKLKHQIYFRDFISQNFQHTHNFQGITQASPELNFPFAKETRPDNKSVVFCIRVDAAVGVVDGGGVVDSIQSQPGSKEKFSST